MSEGIKSTGAPAHTGIRSSFVRVDSRVIRKLRHINWPLWIGGIITLGLILIAIYGQNWALQDPMKENYALRVNGQIVRPPYPPFTIDGYPFGTDQFGRDLLSRILWGIRPTLILVGVVAAVRLLLGLLLGVTIGWSEGRGSHILDTILSVALAIPVLIVALIGISMVDIEKGLSAFIFGLAITGWAETARIVSSQTRIIKGQAYIEAAHALGASNGRILRKHVLHHISPLVWMLLAFEISATLMVISELGFLGYYIGGGVWIEILDFVAVNTTGMPELGQMLSMALQSLTKPLVLIVVGTFVFLMIFGFNMLGEGLRLSLNRPISVGSARSPIIGGRIGDWWEEQSIHLMDWLDTNTARMGYAGALVLVLIGWMVWKGSQPKRKPVAEIAYLAVPGGHLWASEWHDAQGTRWVKTSGPKTADILWTYLSEDPLVGGPAVASDGTIYISTEGNSLVAVSPQGEKVWIADLEATPVGSPALGPAGEVYVSDIEGGLSALTSAGELLWRFTPKGGREGTSGPIVDSQGNIYYTRVDSVQAVSPVGTSLWLAVVFDGYSEEPPIISAGEGYIFLVSGASSARRGAPLNLDKLTSDEIKLTTPAFFIGANGDTYIRTGHEVMRWVATEEGVVTDPPISWNYAGTVSVPPISQGITPEELVWLFYASDFTSTNLIWLDKSSRLLSNIHLPDKQSELLAVDENSTAYICSNNFKVGVNCKAMLLGNEKPLWKLNLGDNLQLRGGAIIPERMYITTDIGKLIAVGKPGGQTPSTSNILNTEQSQAEPPVTRTPGNPTTTPISKPTMSREASSITPELDQVEGLKLFFPLIRR